MGNQPPGPSQVHTHAHIHMHTCTHAPTSLRNREQVTLTYGDWLNTCRDFRSGQVEQTPGACQKAQVMSSTHITGHLLCASPCVRH